MFGNIFTFKIKETLSVKLQALLNAPVIELDTIDSTNNYAMRLIDADTAQPGLTIVTDVQTSGKGQRGKVWLDTFGESLLMSMVIRPEYCLDDQFAFNMAVSLAIADYLQEIYENWDIRIKWPNDIIINDKKAGGILIENVLRGSQWAYSVVGLGLNVLQQDMPSDIPFATSLRIESGKSFVIFDLVSGIREKIFSYIVNKPDPDWLLRLYNESLYRRNDLQRFRIGKDEFTAKINYATPDGRLQLCMSDGNTINYSHGSIEWVL